MEALVVLVVLGAISLGVLNIVEIIEYRRYQKAAHAVIALGASMQISFDQVAEHINQFGTRLQAVSQGTLINEQDINMIKAVVQLHNEVLKLESLKTTFQLNEKLKEVSGLNDQDPIGEVQR